MLPLALFEKSCLFSFQIKVKIITFLMNPTGRNRNVLYIDIYNFVYRHTVTLHIYICAHVLKRNWYYFSSFSLNLSSLGSFIFFLPTDAISIFSPNQNLCGQDLYFCNQPTCSQRKSNTGLCV